MRRSNCTQQSVTAVSAGSRRSRQGMELLAEAQRVLNILYTRREMTPNEVRRVRLRGP